MKKNDVFLPSFRIEVPEDLNIFFHTMKKIVSKVKNLPKTMMGGVDWKIILQTWQIWEISQGAAISRKISHPPTQMQNQLLALKYLELGMAFAQVAKSAV